MAYGLQCFRADGTKFIDTTLKAGRFIAKGTTTSNTVSIPGMESGSGTWWVMAYQDVEGGNDVAITINNGSFTMSGSGTRHYYVIQAVSA
jgi:hypothetical protein